MDLLSVENSVLHVRTSLQTYRDEAISLILARCQYRFPKCIGSSDQRELQ